MVFPVAVVLVLAWGVLAFGAVYPWAYQPLAVAAAAVGVFGLRRREQPRLLRMNWPLGWSVALVAAAIALQIVPLSPGVVDRLSPAAEALRVQMDLGYAAARAAAPPAGAGQAVPLSLTPANTRTALWLFAAFGLLVAGLARGLRAKDARTLVAGIVSLGALLALVAIVQRATGQGKIYGFWEPELSRLGLAHGGGPFVNRNHFAGWMLMALPLGLGYFAGLVTRGMEGARPGWRGRVLWFSTPAANHAVLVGAALLVMGLALVLSLSRSGITCFVVALLVTGAVVARRQAAGSRRRVLTGYLVFLAVLSLGWAGLDAIIARFTRTAADFPDRLGAWQDTLRIFLDFPAAGTGLGSYEGVMFFYQSTDPLTRFDYAHNDYAQLMAEGGLLVTVPALLLLGVVVREARRRLRDRATTETRRHGDNRGDERTTEARRHGDGLSTRSGNTGTTETRRHGENRGDERTTDTPDPSLWHAVNRRAVSNDTGAHHGAAVVPAMFWIRVGAVTGLVAIGLQEFGEYSLQMPGNTALFVVLVAVAAGRLPHRRRSEEF